MGFALEAVIIVVVLIGIRLVADAPYTGPRVLDVGGAVLSVLGMGGVVLGILVWQEGGELRRHPARRRSGGPGGARLLAAASPAPGSRPSSIPALFASKPFRLGISGQMLQQVSLGGTMIALPIYLQMVFEYNAMLAGLSMAPLSLSMFADGLAGREASRSAAAQHDHLRRLRAGHRSGWWS